MITKSYSVAGLLSDVRGEDRYKAIHAVYALINGFKIQTVTELIYLVEANGKISTELFELCHDGFRIAKHIEKKKLPETEKITISDILSEGENDPS